MGATFPERFNWAVSPFDISTVPRAIFAGLAYVTEDRKGLGLILDEPITKT